MPPPSSRVGHAVRTAVNMSGAELGDVKLVQGVRVRSNDVEVSSAQSSAQPSAIIGRLTEPSAPNRRRVHGPPPAYSTGEGPRPQEMDRAPMRADSHIHFAPTPTHYQFGIKRVTSSSSPDARRC